MRAMCIGLIGYNIAQILDCIGERELDRGMFAVAAIVCCSLALRLGVES